MASSHLHLWLTQTYKVPAEQRALLLKAFYAEDYEMQDPLQLLVELDTAAAVARQDKQLVDKAAAGQVPDWTELGVNLPRQFWRDLVCMFDDTFSPPGCVLIA